MMKQMLLMTMLVALACPPLEAGRGGGAAVAGALGGLAVGTMIGSATASESRRSARAEQEAIRAQDKAEQVRQEQERERIRQLERDVDRRGSHTTFFLLVLLVSVLLFAVIGLFLFVMRRKP